MSLPTITVEIAFTTAPLATPTWTDVSSYVRRFSTRRGRSNILGKFEAGTATIILNNLDRRFDPTNTSSPYNGNIKPMKRVRIRATYNAITYDVFQGFVESWTMGYPGMLDSVATVELTDMFKLLALKELDSPYAMEVLKDSPKGYWKLNETANTQAAVDSSGNGYDGAYLGSPTVGQSDPITDGVDGAVLFDATSEYMHVNGAEPQGTNPFTVVGWVNVASTDVGYLWRQFSSFDPNQLLGGMQVYVTADPDSVAVETYDLVTWSFLSVTTAITGGSWHHIAAVRESGGTLRLYKDGAEVGNSSPVLRSISANVGGRVGYTLTTESALFTQVAIYESALSSTRITAHYDARNGWSGDLSGTRIGRILDFVGISSTDRDLDTGNTTLTHGGDMAGQSALEHIQKVEESENGWFYISKDGKATFIERHAISKSPYSTSQATFGDSGAELGYTAIEPALDDDDVYNDISVSRRDGATARAKDTTSQTDYGKRNLSRTGQLMNSDSEAKDASNWLKNRFKDPVLRMPTLEINPQAAESTLYPQVLGRELLDRITIKRRPPGGGSVMSQDVHIQGITHDVTPDSWITRFDVFPTDGTTYWLIGTAGFSEVGQTTVVGY